MKSLTCIKPGEFAYDFVNMPSKELGKTILKVERIGICGTDLHAYEGTQPYFNYPRILGHELALSIVDTDAVGFSEGELVTIIPYFHCGVCVACKMDKPNCCVDMSVFGVHRDGGMREYIQVPNDALIHGNGLTLEELALVEPLAIGAHAVRRANILPNEFVLVIGAGPIGLGVVEFASIAGAKTMVMETNEFRLNFSMENSNAMAFVNPLLVNPIDKLMEITKGEMPTVVFDATGNLGAINQGFRYISHGGRYVLVGLQKEALTLSHPEFHKREATLMSSRNATTSDFEQVIKVIQQGNMHPTKFITHHLPFDKLASEFADLLDPSSQVIKAMVSF